MVLVLCFWIEIVVAGLLRASTVGSVLEHGQHLHFQATLQ